MLWAARPTTLILAVTPKKCSVENFLIAILLSQSFATNYRLANTLLKKDSKAYFPNFYGLGLISKNFPLMLRLLT